MCGIAGIVGLGPTASAPKRDELTRMVRALRHRGPDEFGIYRDDEAGLGHARLSIIDLVAGHQPMASYDGTLWLSFNGEVYNYVELRQELEELGYKFRTQSDTEVVLHGYQAWGDDAFSRFNGQWAMALWEPKKNSLVLARDPVGIRPLYTCSHNDRLYFASEVKALYAADASIPRNFDPRGIDQTFTFWSIVPPRSVFAGINEVPPGTARHYQNGQWHDHEFWRQSYPTGEASTFQGTVDDAVEVVRDALNQASSLRMLRADVPVASYLSGGLDSSLVAAMGKRALGKQLKTFSLRFRDTEYDESEYQKIMVEHLGSEHHEMCVSRADIASVLPDVLYHAERPILRTAPAPLFLLSKLVRESGIKVVMTGEGADEVFAGYDLFREGVVRRFWAKNPKSQMRPRLLERLYPYLARSPVRQQAMARQFFGRNLEQWQEPGFAHGTRWQTTSALKRLFSSEMRSSLEGVDAAKELTSVLPEEFADWSHLAQDQYFEFRTLLTGYILASQGDRMLMSHSIEGRFPFLDPNVMALAASLPPSYKLRVLDEKHVVKRASEGVVPSSILQRKKQPYRAPDALALVGGEASEWVAELLREENVKEAGVFAPKTVSQLWNKCQRRAASGQFSNADNMALVGVVSTQLLHQRLLTESIALGPDIHLTTNVNQSSDNTAES